MVSKRIILDTNLWVSFFISNRLSELDEPIFRNELILIFSNELIEEFVEVASRPKFKKYFSQKEIEQVLHYFEHYGELIKVKSDLKLCRDFKDNFLLNLSVDSGANYLVTGDKDLLILKKVEKTKIISYSDFIPILKL